MKKTRYKGIRWKNQGKRWRNEGYNKGWKEGEFVSLMNLVLTLS
jgi:hypothetical protein